jgi:hypothetical protein
MKAFFVLAMYGAVAMPTTASAQSPNSPAAHSSDDHGLAYTSPLASYKRFQDAPPGAWQDANQTVNRIGGWRAYARQAQESEAVPAKETSTLDAATPPPKPQPEAVNPHMHHEGKK